MGSERREARDLLGFVACFVCAAAGCAVMTGAGSVVFNWLYMQGDLVDVMMLPVNVAVSPLLWFFSLSWEAGYLGLPLLTLILPLACLLLCGLVAGIAGNRKDHPYIGFVLGLLPGVIAGAYLMAVLCHRMGVTP